MYPPYPVIDAHVHVMPWEQVHPDAAASMSNRDDFEAMKAVISDPQRLIPFGGIDPRRHVDVAAQMEYLLGELALRRIKLHPPHQLFHVNDYLNDESLRGLATVYEKCIAYGVPVMVHTGTSVFPRARNKYGRPLDVDDVLVDFPEGNSQTS